jgi:hypothetical protein
VIKLRRALLPNLAASPDSHPCCFQFAVMYDARAAPPLDRMEVINAFATRVPVGGAVRRSGSIECM